MVKFLQEHYRKPIERQLETITSIQEKFGITLKTNNIELPPTKKKKKKKPKGQSTAAQYTLPTRDSKTWKR